MVEIITCDWTATKHGLWKQGRGSDGEYYAARDTTPLFCVSAQSQEEADRQAGEVFESYIRLMN